MEREPKHARLCVPVGVGRAAELPAAVDRAAALGDFIELRLDRLDEGELGSARRDLPQLIGRAPRPLILTLRPRAQGGRRELSLKERLLFWRELFTTLPPRAAYFDLELDLTLALNNYVLGERERPDWSHVICSHHDFAGVPADLQQIYERMSATPARILKVAVRAEDVTDCLAVLRLLEHARRAGRELIAIGMGEAGLLTRVLAPARGAFLTYGALDEAGATAPGQLTAAELRELYRLDRIDEETVVTGLVGSPVAHSLSPDLHNAAFAAARLNGVYLPFATRDARAFLRRMAHPRTRELDWDLRGLSVTAPHKQSIMEALDRIDPTARSVGAVNTIVVAGDELHGYNTDARAALAPLEKVIKLRGARAAVLGAGGAARAVLWGLRAAWAQRVVFARDPARARANVTEFTTEIRELEGARFDDFDLVVNTTPLGTRGRHEDQTPATAEQLRGARCAYDPVYHPAETHFMREARAAGCREVFGGLPMLVAQAAAQFELWTGRAAPLEVMRAAALAKLNVSAPVPPAH